MVESVSTDVSLYDYGFSQSVVDQAIGGIAFVELESIEFNGFTAAPELDPSSSQIAKEKVRNSQDFIEKSHQRDYFGNIVSTTFVLNPHRPTLGAAASSFEPAAGSASFGPGVK